MSSNQLRKFEQDAITNEILSDLTKMTKASQVKAEKSKSYKEIEKKLNFINLIMADIRALENKMATATNEMDVLIKEFNVDCNEDYFRLQYSNYRHSRENAMINWDTQTYVLRSQVEQKLALALISPDWKDRLQEIINSITEELSTGGSA